MRTSTSILSSFALSFWAIHSMLHFVALLLMSARLRILFVIPMLLFAVHPRPLTVIYSLALS